jgi:hypothetical protein
MAYSGGFLDQIGDWIDSGVIPLSSQPARVVEIGAQMFNAGTPHATISRFIKRWRPAFDDHETETRFPTSPYFYCYAADVWRLAGFDYASYDVTDDAPGCRLFDLNFGDVPAPDRGTADIVTNLGTTEHVANQLNAFRAIHDLLKIGGVAIHQVPFTGMLNHGLFNYHPKFFFSLTVNNRYRLRHVEFSGPKLHADLGEGNTVFEGDRLRSAPNCPGTEAWADITTHSGMVMLVIERRYDDPFVPPVDFAAGYFAETTGCDLSVLVGVDDLPASAWADSYRRRQTPSQMREVAPPSSQAATETCRPSSPRR